MASQLETIFGELGISQYLHAFVDQGFDTWETILDITESDLDALGVKLGHRRKLQRRIANSRGVAPETSLATTAQPSIEDARSPETQRAETLRPETRDTHAAVVTKRKYRRHPKPDENAPERPPSAYVLFSNKMREELKGRNLTFTEIAKLVGENWQSLSQGEKEPFESQAQAIKDRYHADLAEYKKTAEYKKYCAYLQDFKAKHSLPSQEKEVSKRIKLEASGARGSTNATPSRTSRSGSSGSGREGRQLSEPPIKREQRMDSVMSNGSPSPSEVPVSPEEPFRSPATTTLDRHSAERSPTFSATSRDLPAMQGRPHLNWMDDQQLKHPSAQRHLPSLSDVFENQRLMGPGRPADGNGYGYQRERINDNSPGPLPSLGGNDDPRSPPMLRHEQSSTGSTTSGSRYDQSSAGSTSSGSSYGYPRTPLDGPMPIHALLASNASGGGRFEPGQATSYFQAASEHKQAYMQQVNNGGGGGHPNGYPNGLANPHQLPHSAYGGQTPTNHAPTPRKPDLNLDGMNALLQAAGEIVNRRPAQ